MTPPVVMDEAPRLFVPDFAEPLLEHVVLSVLADGDHAVCLVCAGPLHLVMGGVRCDECGAELLIGSEPLDAEDVALTAEVA